MHPSPTRFDSVRSHSLALSGCPSMSLAPQRLRSANGVNGMSDIEGKAAREAASECGQRASFNGDRGSGRPATADSSISEHGREARRVSNREITNGASGKRCDIDMRSTGTARELGSSSQSISAAMMSGI